VTADLKNGIDATNAGIAIKNPITGNTVKPVIRNKTPIISKIIPIINADNFSPKQASAFIVLSPFF
jgi:hypothetical protein